MVSTKQLGIACLVLLVLGVVATVSDADRNDSYTGVIAGVEQPQTRSGGTVLGKVSHKLELKTEDNTWDLSGHERELQALEGQPVTVLGAAHNGTIQVAAFYRPRY